jgi:hypothetical protein
LLEDYSGRVGHMFKQEMYIKVRLGNIMRKYHVLEVCLSRKQTVTVNQVLLVSEDAKWGEMCFCEAGVEPAIRTGISLFLLLTVVCSRNYLRGVKK